MNRRKRRELSAIYCRSYLITLGLCFIGVFVFVLIQNTADGRVVPWWGYLILGIFFFGGLALTGLGLMGPSNRMEKWADAASTHWVSLIIMVLAYPIYLIISPFYAKR